MCERGKREERQHVNLPRDLHGEAGGGDAEVLRLVAFALLLVGPALVQRRHDSRALRFLLDFVPHVLSFVFHFRNEA